MFGGIVECIGTVIQLNIDQGCNHLTIKPTQPWADYVVGESIAINGVCLTVTGFNEDTFNVTVVPETLRLTNLAQLTIGGVVNLERSLPVNARVGGHFVQGHVDGMGRILDIKHDNGNALLVKIGVDKALAKYIVNKGYITLDGMSITVIETNDDWFTITFIPHTQEVTITHRYQVGDFINIEVDMVGKYIEKILGAMKHELSN